MRSARTSGSANRRSSRVSLTTIVRPRRTASRAIGIWRVPDGSAGTFFSAHWYVTRRSSSDSPSATTARDTPSAPASSWTVPRRISSGSRLARARWDTRFTMASRSARASASETDDAEGLEHVVMDDERDRHVGPDRMAYRLEEPLADVVELQRTGERRREPEDRAELLLALLLRGLRPGERVREAVHDRGGDKADPDPHDEGHDLDRREDVTRIASRDQDPAVGELEGVDVLDREEDGRGVEGRRRDIEAERARQLAHPSFWSVIVTG